MPAFKVCAVAVAASAPATHARHRPADRRTTAPCTVPHPADRGTRLKSTPRFLQGVYPFTGEGLTSRSCSTRACVYTVPARPSTAQALYFRGGNSTDELVYVVLVRDGVPMRWFPIGAKGDMHVPLRVVEDLHGGTRRRAARGRRPRASPASSSSTWGWWRS